jgi:hypothetical protein
VLGPGSRATPRYSTFAPDAFTTLPQRS